MAMRANDDANCKTPACILKVGFDGCWVFTFLIGVIDQTNKRIDIRHGGVDRDILNQLAA